MASWLKALFFVGCTAGGAARDSGNPRCGLGEVAVCRMGGGVAPGFVLRLAPQVDDGRAGRSLDVAFLQAGNGELSGSATRRVIDR